MSSADRPTADSVRLAWPAEAGAVADLQRRVWAADLPPGLGAALLTGVGREDMVRAWEQAVTRPPQARYRVLVAVEEGRVVGFATTVPSTDGDAEPGVDGEVGEFAVDPAARHRGHGSRLLHACADTLRADGFRRARWWVASTDDALRRFLTEAGWAPDGGHREIGPGNGDPGEDAGPGTDGIRLRQVRLHTDLG